MQPVEQLSQQISTLPLQDEPQFRTFLALAARLAALGETTQIERAPGLAATLGINLDQTLAKCSRKGVVAFDKSGAELAEALIMAQDFNCLLLSKKITLAEETRLCLQGWIDEAADVLIDDAALQRLQEFAAAYPLPEVFCLAAVFSPVTHFELTALAASAEPRKTVELSWGRAVRVTKEEHAFAFVSKPTDSLKDYYKRSHVEINVPGEGRHRLSRRLEEDWRVVFSIEQNDGRAAEIESVRLGVLPARQIDPTRWAVEISPYGRSACLAALDQTVVIRFGSGTRLKML